MANKSPKQAFTRYEVFIITMMAFMQFAIVLDFMVLSPLGPMLMKDLSMSSEGFSQVVSAYAFSAGISGFLAAGFADKFDRKKLLLFFFIGFIVGTFFCAMADSYETLLFARIFTGVFGGVIGSISFAIIGDLFAMQVRGRVMGFVQMSFAVSQVIGLPVGLYLANLFQWHMPFFAIVSLSIVAAFVIVVYMKPVTAHIAANKDRNAFSHLWKTISNNNYLKAFLATTVLATGGYMLMPFGTVFATGNLGLTMEQLPFLYAVTGVFTMIGAPLMGKLSDSIGKFKLFFAASVVTAIIVAIYTNLGLTPLWMVMGLNVILFIGITGRMISYSALATAVPNMADRGAFMSINSSIQQVAGGFAALLAGVIAHESNHKMVNYPAVGYVVLGSMTLGVFLMYIVDKMVKSKTPEAPYPMAQETHPDTIDELEPIVQPVSVENKKDDF